MVYTFIRALALETARPGPRCRGSRAADRLLEPVLGMQFQQERRQVDKAIDDCPPWRRFARAFHSFLLSLPLAGFMPEPASCWWRPWGGISKFSAQV
ncbi:hypothetical protein PROPHIGD53-3_34 [Mycobacterium phage prophiGD53-3]|nr:hypothetical protein PROPHIGD53-3_34 [Mycobacterium phage prophiGD53-3]